ncbi:hypothetical protein ACFVIM_11960 [Streptomyces sp. NPDC057638]|uniref:hypothetical protein n=1 Tax=Streptomyces sp. NPDC057638 TaxID=3346190 RepID=UPI0036C38A54
MSATRTRRTIAGAALAALVCVGAVGVPASPAHAASVRYDCAEVIPGAQGSAVGIACQTVGDAPPSGPTGPVFLENMSGPGYLCASGTAIPGGAGAQVYAEGCVTLWP